MNNRRDDIDYARGIAMLLIVIGHTPDLNSIVVKVLYSFHVPLFFIITGISFKPASFAARHLLSPAIIS